MLVDYISTENKRLGNSCMHQNDIGSSSARGNKPDRLGRVIARPHVSAGDSDAFCSGLVRASYHYKSEASITCVLSLILLAFKREV